MSSSRSPSPSTSNSSSNDEAPTAPPRSPTDEPPRRRTGIHVTHSHPMCDTLALPPQDPSLVGRCGQLAGIGVDPDTGFELPEHTICRIVGSKHVLGFSHLYVLPHGCSTGFWVMQRCFELLPWDIQIQCGDPTDVPGSIELQMSLKEAGVRAEECERQLNRPKWLPSEEWLKKQLEAWKRHHKETEAWMASLGTEEEDGKGGRRGCKRKVPITTDGFAPKRQREE